MRFHIINALLYKYWCITKNRLDRMFDIFYWPLIVLLIWGFTSVYLKEFTDILIVNIFLSATILWVFFQRTAQDVSVYILEDFWSRNLYNLFATPMTSLELITSVVIFGFFRSIIAFFFLAFIAILLYSFNIFSLGIVIVAIFALALIIFGWTVGIFVSAIIFRYGMRIQVFAWSLPFIIQPFSAVYYPLNSVPLWVQHISIIFPTTHIFEGMRSIIHGQGIPMSSLFWAFITNFALLIFAIFFFRR